MTDLNLTEMNKTSAWIQWNAKVLLYIKIKSIADVCLWETDMKITF